MSATWIDTFRQLRKDLSLQRVSLSFHEDDNVFFSTKVGEYRVVLPLSDVLGKSSEEVRTLLYETLLDLIQRNGETSFSVWLHRPGRKKAVVAKYLAQELAIDVMEATLMIENAPCRIFRTSTRKLAVNFSREIKKTGADIRCSWEKP